jgi:WD40 repeat protein
VAFSPVGNLLAAASADQTVRLWGLTDAAPVAKAVLTASNGVARLLQFTPDGKTLVAVYDRQRLVKWDLATGASLNVWSLPQAMMCSAALTCDARYLAVGSSEGTVSAFRLASGESEKGPPVR